MSRLRKTRNKNKSKEEVRRTRSIRKKEKVQKKKEDAAEKKQKEGRNKKQKVTTKKQQKVEREATTTIEKSRNNLKEAEVVKKVAEEEKRKEG
jgi:hypothetical protein